MPNSEAYMQSFTRRMSKGFTLIELVIAMAIGLLMMAGLIQIFLANRAAYRVMEGANFMQENMRFAVDRIAQSLRMADHWGTVPRRAISGSDSTATVCTAGWARNLTSGIQAFDGAATIPSALTGCFDAANYQPNTDVVMVRYAGPDVISPAATLDTSQYYVRTITGEVGFLYPGSSPNTTLTTSNQPGRQYLISPYSAEMFWVRSCSDPGVDDICLTADDGDTPIAIPTLMRSFLSGNSWTTEAVAEGMEQLQIEYRVMNTGWRSATQVSALTAPAQPWDAITGARVTGIMRSAQRDTSFPVDARTFNLSTDTSAFVADVAAQRFLRTAYEASVVLRNRMRPAPSTIPN